MLNKSSPSVKPKTDFSFIDLFAGVGGIRMGFERQGGHCVFTSEWNKFACETYTENYHDSYSIAGDIRDVDVSMVPDHDVLLAGFPCQPFSIAGISKKNSLGRASGFEDKTQGTMFFEVARIIKAKQPHAFLLENVRNLLSHDKGQTFTIIREVLEKELGYQVFWKIIDGQHFVPQHRERILIVGFRKNTGFNWDSLPLPEIGAASPKLREILHPENGTEVDVDNGRYIDAEGKVLPKYTISDHLWNYLQAYAAKHRAKGNGFGYGLVRSDEISRTLSARYYKDGAEILVWQGEGRNPRRLTPRECARLMGYPDKFKIPVSDNQAYKQFGNSVVMPLMEHVASMMKPWILKLKWQDKNS